MCVRNSSSQPDSSVNQKSLKIPHEIIKVYTFPFTIFCLRRSSVIFMLMEKQKIAELHFKTALSGLVFCPFCHTSKVTSYVTAYHQLGSNFKEKI